MYVNVSVKSEHSVGNRNEAQDGEVVRKNFIIPCKALLFKKGQCVCLGGSVS